MPNQKLSKNVSLEKCHSAVPEIMMSQTDLTYLYDDDDDDDDCCITQTKV
jgi:hypothetical protein